MDGHHRILRLHPAVQHMRCKRNSPAWPLPRVDPSALGQQPRIPYHLSTPFRRLKNPPMIDFRRLHDLKMLAFHSFTLKTHISTVSALVSPLISLRLGTWYKDCTLRGQPQPCPRCTPDIPILSSQGKYGQSNYGSHREPSSLRLPAPVVNSSHLPRLRHRCYFAHLQAPRRLGDHGYSTQPALT